MAELKRRARRDPGGRNHLPEFQEIVWKAGRLRKSWARVPAALKGFSEARGALVVLKKPYPFFERLPQAAFRAILRIDGDELLRQIASIYQKFRRKRPDRKLLLPYC